MEDMEAEPYNVFCFVVILNRRIKELITSNTFLHLLCEVNNLCCGSPTLTISRFRHMKQDR